MNQSGLIIGAIFLTFFMYITIKGELPTYAGLLLLSPAGGSTTPQQASSLPSSSITANAVVQEGFAAFGL